MELKIVCKGKKSDMLRAATEFYAEKLNISKHDFSLLILTTNIRSKTGTSGSAAKLGHKEYGINIDGRMNPSYTLSTLAHEMVHIKQLVKGQLSYTLGEGDRASYKWRGKRVRRTYMNRQWEKEAYRRENELFDELVSYVKTKKEQNERAAEKVRRG